VYLENRDYWRYEVEREAAVKPVGPSPEGVFLSTTA
jgi:hypothetical protein